MGVKSEYADTGCELNPTCLNCPIPLHKCPAENRRRQLNYRENRNFEVRKLYHEGVAAKTLSIEFDLTVRTIYRIIAEGESGEPSR